MKFQLVVMCSLLAAGGVASTPVAAGPIARIPPTLACSTAGFSGPSPLNRTADSAVKCWSAEVTCPRGSELVQNGTDLGGHPAIFIGYDPSRRAFFYTCAPIVRQPPPR